MEISYESGICKRKHVIRNRFFRFIKLMFGISQYLEYNWGPASSYTTYKKGNTRNLKAFVY